MRFMIFIKTDPATEAADYLPSAEEMAAMGAYNEELVKAGVLLDGGGLHPSSNSVKVRFSGDERTVVDGPFTESKELVAGYWLIQTKTKEEAIEWVKRCPNTRPDLESEIEIRQLFEPEDFGEAYTDEVAEQDQRVRDQIEKNQ